MHKKNASKIGAAVFLAAIVSLAGWFVFSSVVNSRGGEVSQLHEARYYEQLGDDAVRCNLCPNFCTLTPGAIGKCKARKNIGGKLFSLVYGNIAAKHLDPIEKKPLYHFLPGTAAYSIATTGCNLACRFCQNWQISQIFPWEGRTEPMTPEQVVDEALKSGAKSIAFTYNEPTIFYEFMFDVAQLAHAKGLKTAVISAGFINPEPLRALLPYIDAYKIDFKGFNPEFYRRMTNGEVAPVLAAMKAIKESGTWLEIVNLVIPGENDSTEDLMGLINWVKDNLGTDVPVHFLRFHPDYKLRNLPSTPVETIKRARQMAMDAGLNYVYTGNIPFEEGETTFCPTSHKPAIVRQGFFVVKDDLTADGRCRDGEKIPGIWR
jgi:pyruvate formate lyase activating enzyme